MQRVLMMQTQSPYCVINHAKIQSERIFLTSEVRLLFNMVKHPASTARI